MKFVIFGLTISSSWGNGHATLWRGLCRALAAASHEMVFFERDTEYYRAARDLQQLEGLELVLYSSWSEVQGRAARELRSADVAMVTSYCPDGVRASELVLEAAGRAQRVFYDLDTPVTLASIENGQLPPYLSARGLADFDLVLSFTGGPALELLRDRLGARRVAPLYGHVDPTVHRPVAATPRFRCALSYLGTYSPDRQSRLEELFFAPAALRAGSRFVLGGSQYPSRPSLPGNVIHHSHVPPEEHATFFCSSRLTLNLTRATMARLGHCPSGRLFEAAACGVPLLSDWFDGLDAFFEPDQEITIVQSHRDVLDALDSSDAELAMQAARALDRVLSQHTSRARAAQLASILASVPD